MSITMNILQAWWWVFYWFYCVHTFCIGVIILFAGKLSQSDEVIYVKGYL